MSNDNNWVWKPDGIHECEPKIFKLTQRLRNVTVEILESDDGEVSIGWYRQDDTEDITDNEDFS